MTAAVAIAAGTAPQKMAARKHHQIVYSVGIRVTSLIATNHNSVHRTSRKLGFGGFTQCMVLVSKLLILKKTSPITLLFHAFAG
jgi:hypothetical protein